MRLKNIIALIGVLGVLVIEKPAQAANLQGFSFEVGKSIERITILSDAKLKQKKAFLLQNPNRLVIDFFRFKAEQASLPENYRGKLVRGVRTGKYGDDTTRIVFDLSAPVEVIASYHVEPAGQLWRYVMDIRKNEASEKAQKAAPLKHEAKQVAKEKTTFVITNAKSIPEHKGNPSAQLVKKIIVIDPGHGGKDPGASGALHKEKDLTLRFAESLQKELEQRGGYKVLLTRETDIFIPLKKRVVFAQKHKADLFLSLHADSNPNKKAKGVSLYTLSETASDEESAALAAHENKADIIDGVDLGEADADVTDILIDLTQRETMRISADVADVIVNKLKGKVPLVSSPHRYAGFRVLKTLDVPSVLVELGFLSSKEDERRLASTQYRRIVSSALAQGVHDYLKNRKTVAAR